MYKKDHQGSMVIFHNRDKIDRYLGKNTIV